MSVRHFSLALAMLVLAGGSACAVNRPAAGAPTCTVEGGESLPAGSGGADALCAAIEEAALPADARVAVRVIAPNIIGAVVRIGDRTLPEIKMARSDKDFDARAFERFAQALVDASAK